MLPGQSWNLRNFHHFFGNRVDRFVEAGRVLSNEVFDQSGNVIRALAQGRKKDRDDIEAIVQVGAELACRHQLSEILIGRSHDAHVDAYRPPAAQSLELLFLQSAQELRLQLQRKVADLVKEQRPVIRLLEPTHGLRDCAGEGSSFVAEEFALQQRTGNRGAVQFYKRSAAAQALIVNGTGDDFLARTGFALDQRDRIAFRDDANLIQHISKRWTPSHDVVFDALGSDIPFKHCPLSPFRYPLRCDDYTRGSGTQQLDERIGDTLVLPGDLMIPASLRNRVLFALTIVAMVQSARAQDGHTTVPEEILERPAPLRSGIGKAHEDVTTSFKDAQAYYDQGLAYLHSYVWIEAARSFHQALRVDTKLAMAQLGLSYALAELGDSAGARQASQQASTLAGPASDREKARIRLRALQLGDGSEPAKQRSNYLKEFDLILAKYSHDAELLMLRGQADQQVPDALRMGMPGMGAGEASLTFYERALAEQPHYFAAHHYLTHAYENVGRMDLALKHAEEYVSLAPAVPHAHHMHGHILRRVSRTQEAIAEFRTGR